MTKINTDNIGVIVLAAGYSKRFNADKRQARLQSGETLLDATLNKIPICFQQRVLVLHPGDEEFGKRYQDDWTLCIAKHASKGMGHSLAAAMPYCQNWDAAVIALADMPYVQSNTYQAIQQELTSHPLVRPSCQDRVGNPVGFQSTYFKELAELSGDQGARNILKRHEKELHLMACLDWGVIQDVDTVTALNRPES
ncbi:MAG: nucleotidyltransferase family protein [Gammaproteobacteria bacterium]|nr:nucleotidyltransferase family protein [Gammaproteobacteria bacterium]